MAATFAQVDDVLAAFDGTVPTDHRGWIQNRLDFAEQLVTATAGDLTARIAAGQTTAEAVKLVLVEMVLRVLKNPSGYRQEAVGPFSYTLDSSLSTGQVYLTRTDRRLLGLSVGATTLPLSDPALPYVHWPYPRVRRDPSGLPLP